MQKYQPLNILLNTILGRFKGHSWTAYTHLHVHTHALTHTQLCAYTAMYRKHTTTLNEPDTTKGGYTMYVNDTLHNTRTHARTHTHTHTHTLRLKVLPYMSCRYTYISSSQQEETITTSSPWFLGRSVYKSIANAIQYIVEEI